MIVRDHFEKGGTAQGILFTTIGKNRQTYGKIVIVGDPFEKGGTAQGILLTTINKNRNCS